MTTLLFESEPRVVWLALAWLLLDVELVDAADDTDDDETEERRLAIRLASWPPFRSHCSSLLFSSSDLADKFNLMISSLLKLLVAIAVVESCTVFLDKSWSGIKVVFII